MRLSQGDYARQQVYNENPLEVAKAFEDSGVTRLHLVDLDGAKASHVVNYKTLEQIAGHTSLTIDFGGGVKSDEDLHIAFESGARLVTGGSIAVRDRDRFVGGSSGMAKSASSWVPTYGTRKSRPAAGSTTSDVELIPFVRDYMQVGIEQVITTDIARDGMLQGAP